MRRLRVALGALLVIPDTATAWVQAHPDGTDAARQVD